MVNETWPGIVVSLSKSVLYTPIAFLQRKSRAWVLNQSIDAVQVHGVKSEVGLAGTGVSVALEYRIELSSEIEDSSELMLLAPIGPIRVVEGHLQSAGRQVPIEFPLGQSERILSVRLPPDLNATEVTLVVRAQPVDWSFFRDSPGLLHLPFTIPEISKVRPGTRLASMEVQIRSSGLDILGYLETEDGRLLQATIGEPSETRHAMACGMDLTFGTAARLALNEREIVTLSDNLDRCVSFLADLFGWYPRGALVVTLLRGKADSSSRVFFDQTSGVVISFTPRQLRLAKTHGMGPELARQLSGLWWGGAVRLVGPQDIETRAALGVSAGLLWAEATGRQKEAGLVLGRMAEFERWSHLRDWWFHAATGRSLRRYGDLARKTYSLLRDPRGSEALRELHSANVGYWIPAAGVHELIDGVAA